MPDRLLKDGLKDSQFSIRYQYLLAALLCCCGKGLREEFNRQWIGSLSDAELLDYLPQLVQVGGLAFPPVLMVPPPGPQDRLYSTGILAGVEYGQSTKPPVPCLLPGLKV